MPDLEQSSTSKKSLGTGKAILVGQFVVNFPVLFILLIFSCSGIFLSLLSLKQFGMIQIIIAFLACIIPFVIGFAIAWLWWAFSVPRWRQWALNNGVPADELQKWGVITGLVWPKGFIFEKTEIKPKE